MVPIFSWKLLGQNTKLQTRYRSVNILTSLTTPPCFQIVLAMFVEVVARCSGVEHFMSTSIQQSGIVCLDYNNYENAMVNINFRDDFGYNMAKLFLHCFQTGVENMIGMIFQPSSKPILIYFKTRGNAQIIRSVLLEVEADFQQIFVGNDGSLQPNIIKNYQIDINEIPYLIHNGIAINGVFPIVKYCCNYFKRPDLLGKNLQDKVLITQIMMKEIRHRGIILHTLFKGLKQIQEKNTGEQGVISLCRKLFEVAHKNNQLYPIKQMFSKSGQYLCGYLTILDFTFYQKTFYASNLLSLKFQQVEIAKRFCKFFESTSFYKKNESKLSQYKVFFPEFDQHINSLIKKMWQGDPKFIASD